MSSIKSVDHTSLLRARSWKQNKRELFLLSVLTNTQKTNEEILRGVAPRSDLAQFDNKDVYFITVQSVSWLVPWWDHSHADLRILAVIYMHVVFFGGVCFRFLREVY